MKSITLSVLFAAVIFSACNSDSDSKSATTSVVVDEIKPELSKDAITVNSESKSNAELLMEKSDCYTCHSLDSKLIGPSFKEVATKYANTDGNIQSLAEKIINGGSGVWGEVPMQAHSQMSKVEATEMGKFILSIK